MLRIALLGLIASAGIASADTVTFEELGAQPSSFSQTVALRNQIAGVSFSGPGSSDGGAVLNVQSNFGIDPRSGDNFLAFNRNSAAQMSDGGRPLDPETITFVNPASSVEIYAAGGSNFGSFRMEAFDASNVSLGSDTQGAGDSWVRLSVSSGSPIAKIVLTEVTGIGAFVYDDLSFTSVPTPGALGVLAAGGMLAGRRRR